MDNNHNSIEEIEFPEVLRSKLDYVTAQFPDAVDYDKEERAITFREKFPRDVSVAMSYFYLVCEVNEIIQNINFVTTDIRQLPKQKYDKLTEYQGRYYLLNRIFFYELLRVKDSLGRFLKRDQDLGFMNKVDRRKAKKMLDEQFEEHYLIRNVYLHGHRIPKSDIEQDVDRIVTAFESGYELISKGSGKALQFSDKFEEACKTRSSALVKIGGDIRKLLYSIIHITAKLSNHILNSEQSEIDSN